MSYVLGYFAADGSMIKNKRGAHFVEFTSTDRILIEQVQKAVSSDHSISVRSRGGNRLVEYRIQFGSKEWFCDLTSLGFVQNKSAVLLLPKIPPDYERDYVRGYFDGDGCVYFNKTHRSDRGRIVETLLTLFTSGSSEYLKSLKELLSKHGLSGGSIKTKNRGFELVFGRRDSLALYRLMYHTSETSLLFLPRKREKLEWAVRSLGLNPYCGSSSTG